MYIATALLKPVDPCYYCWPFLLQFYGVGDRSRFHQGSNRAWLGALQMQALAAWESWAASLQVDVEWLLHASFDPSPLSEGPYEPHASRVCF